VKTLPRSPVDTDRKRKNTKEKNSRKNSLEIVENAEGRPERRKAGPALARNLSQELTDFREK